METLHDLIEEAKLRTVWWAVCIFIVTYFLTHTSKSMWLNVPIAILLVSGVHFLLSEVEFRWKTRKPVGQSYLAHLEKKQLSVNDSRLTTLPPPPKWKRKIDSPVVEAAMDDFVNKILQEFVLDMWYSDITPDKEAPQLIHGIIMDILAEISTRAKDINLVDLLTRDVVDLVGDHLELFRKNQAAIGRDIMVTLSSEERDERLKRHLMASKELHPACISSDSEYKFLKRVMGAVLAAVLRPREAQCPIVRCITRELLTCLVMEPVMKFTSPGQINELIEGIFLANNNKGDNEAGNDQSTNTDQTQNQPIATNHEKSKESTSLRSGSFHNPKKDTPNDQKEPILNPPGTIAGDPVQDKSVQPRSSKWARVLEAATQRRTEVLQPENIEDMWTKGRNYKKKAQKKATQGLQPSVIDGSGINSGINENSNDQPQEQNLDADQSKKSDLLELADESSSIVSGSKATSEKSNSSSDLNIQNQSETARPTQAGGSVISEFNSSNAGGDNDLHNFNIATDKSTRTEGPVPKLRCRVLGAYFETLDSKSFAVYSIGVTDIDNNTWFVKRRYRNFERLHRHLKDIPNYTSQLPPKRIFSSSTEDAFVRQRCIQLDRYLQDLLSIPNIAEQHEVWDFLSMSSKVSPFSVLFLHSYSFGRSSSVVRTLAAVNVDDAMDDIVRQFKGVSDGLMRKVAGPVSPSESSASVSNRKISFKGDEEIDSVTKRTTSDVSNSFSNNEDGEKDIALYHEEVGFVAQANERNLDKLNSKGFAKSDEQNKNIAEARSEILSMGANLASMPGLKEDPLGVPAEVFWMSKQILQLMMEDAIDDWLVRQIHWLRRENVVAQGVRYLQDVLWPEGTFFLKLRANQADSSQSNEGSGKTSSGSKNTKQGSFEEQLQAVRRASEIKKMIFKGAPTTLVSLIGHKQYKRSAKDIYYFLQVNIHTLTKWSIKWWSVPASNIYSKKLQSAVCLKQLGYGLLELILITVFPELQEVIINIHEKKKEPKA
ncbi:Phox-associated domain-containing protein [Artemisia annua]|uniref:Phox-associated domain-containing protein n=1 Tax=Artemisia annua TaxID=35608 RepID=A0A2U1N3K4_ARTAN|nr:Phox-associated domain-containing protein [Artemisia annua]